MKIELKTPKEAENYLKSINYNIQNGEPYAIFACGCVTHNQHAYYLQIKKSKKNPVAKNIRACKKHKYQGLYLGTFKRCNCGGLNFKKFVKAGATCNFCRKKYVNKYHYDYSKRSKFRNANLRDVSRINCKFRSKCIIKYDKYDAIPCKGCRHFWDVGVTYDINKQGFSFEKA